VETLSARNAKTEIVQVVQRGCDAVQANSLSDVKPLKVTAETKKNRAATGLPA